MRFLYRDLVGFFFGPVNNFPIILFYDIYAI